MNTTTKHPERSASGLVLFLAVWFVTSCASVPPAIAPVGPQQKAGGLGLGTGHLIVYSATEEKPVGKLVSYYPHTGYSIKTPDGKPFKWVANHTGVMDQAAQYISLEAGNYLVVAQSESYGRVAVPVVIKSGHNTEVDLEGRWHQRGNPTEGADLVRLPNGEIIGWSAASAESGPK